MTAAPPSTRLGAVSPTREEFRALAVGHRVIPVVRRLLADDETPVGVYRKLAGDRPGTFLFESAENGRSWSRWSFVGAHCAAALTEVDGTLTWTGEVPAGLPTAGDPLAALRAVVEELHSEPLPGLPPLTGGLVGYLGYDAVRRMERLPELAVDDLRIPELVMLLATDLAALDHHEGTVTLIANALNWDATDERVDEAYDDAVARLDRMTAALAAPAPATVAVYHPAEPRFVRRRSPAEHRAAVEAAKEEVRAGEAFQVVVSQRFEAECPTDPLDVYRVLRATNPSPYMYLLRLQSAAGDRFEIVGSSPEALVTVRDGAVTTHPIAGTRWRGATDEEDELLEKDLRTDEKERAEHVMLVDLGRNDLGRVCEPGSVKVRNFFSVERYSHVMHLVSTVTGTLRADRNAVDAVVACFPAGTLSGAPKPRAMEIIEELEPTRRGLYGGIVGYLDFAGNADTAIAIRTALVRDGVAYVQAGGGIVADSDPEAEDIETLNKARAVLSAVATAATLRSPGRGDPAVFPLRGAAPARAAPRARRGARRARGGGAPPPGGWRGGGAPPPPPPAPRSGRAGSGRRRLLAVCAALVLAAGALEAAARLPWFTGSVDAVGRGTVPVSATGADLVAALRPVALLAAAAVAAVVALAGPARRFLAAPLAFAGGGVGTAVVRRLLAPPAPADLAALPGAPAAGTPVPASVAPQAGLVAGALGAVLLLAAAVLLLVGEAGLARLGPRYAARPPAPETAAPAAPGESDRAAWDALDAGHDPTAAPPAAGTDARTDGGGGERAN